ncbi:MAG: sulfur carrier protein ThiS [Pseudomonadota bacterium]
MRITLNGEPRDVTAVRLTDLLDELGFGDARVATALNEQFVAVGDRAGVIVAEGDRLEIVAPMQGG